MRTIYIFLMATFTTIVCNAQCFSTISTGNYYSFGLKPNGSLWAWGNNSAFGQLGDGTEVDRYAPIPITTATWQSIACGAYCMFAIKNNGTLWGCGDNSYSNLGLGNSAPLYRNTLTQLNTSTNWKQIGAGDYSNFGIKTDGTLWGWGQNNYSQLGLNTCCANQTSPIQIGTATDWKQVVATHSLNGFALKTNGTLWAWGLNVNSLIGDSSISQWVVPTQFDSGTSWSKLFAGHEHMLALKTDGSLWAWGNPDHGETTQDPNNILFPAIPLQIAGTWKTAAAGFRISMGIKTDGTLWAWGLDDVGQLGDGGTTNRHIPYQLGTATNWDSVSCGYQFTVALRTDGSLWSWGVNDFGQLGNGSITNATAPTQVPVTGCALGTAAFSANETIFILSPNPATNELSLNYKGTENVDTITIYDLSGRALQTLLALGNANFKTTFQVSQLASGSYILELKNKNKIVATRKFLKE